jgi:hypothetical protein
MVDHGLPRFLRRLSPKRSQDRGMLVDGVLGVGDPQPREEPESLHRSAEAVVCHQQEAVAGALGNELVESHVGLPVLPVLGELRPPRGGTQFGDRTVKRLDQGGRGPLTGPGCVDRLDGKAGVYQLGEFGGAEQRRNPVATQRHPNHQTGHFETGQSLAHRSRRNVQFTSNAVNAYGLIRSVPAVHQHLQQLVVDMVGQHLPDR